MSKGIPYTCKFLLWVRQQFRTTPTQRLVLYALCTWANRSATCYPGIDAIASATSLHRRTVIRVLQELANSGFIIRSTIAKRRSYTLAFAGYTTTCPKVHRQVCEHKPVHIATVLADMTQEPSPM